MAVSIAQAALNVDAFAARAMTLGAPAAARAMAERGRDEDRVELMLTSHSRDTRTPVPAPGSPSMITGELAAAQTAWDPFPVSETVWEAHAGPSSAAASRNGPYGRFLQFGGLHVAHEPGHPMRWLDEDGWHSAYVLDKDERPYLTYALGEIIADGSLHSAAVIAFEEAVS